MNPESLPVSEPQAGGITRRERWLWLGLTVALIWPAPYLGSLRSPNELVRVYSIRALVDDGTLAIDQQIQKHGPLTDRAVRQGKAYSDKAPGLMGLGVPVYAALRIAWEADQIDDQALIRILRTLVIVVPTLGWLLVLRHWLARRGVGVRLRMTAVTLAALGTPGVAYTMKFVGHQAAAWMVGCSLALADLGSGRAHRGVPHRPRLIGAGLLGGLATITEYPTVPIFLAVVGLVGWQSRKKQAVQWVLVGALIPWIAGASYHTLAFGHPWSTGYSFLTHPTFVAVHQQGWMGIGWPSWSAVFGLGVGSQRGLLPLAPWFIAIAAAPWVVKSSSTRNLAAVLIAVCGVQFFIATGFSYWMGGWSVGPRHLVSSLPAFVVLAILGWQRWEIWLTAPGNSSRPILCTLSPVFLRGLALAAVILNTSIAITYPGFPEELAAPWFELTLPLIARGQLGFSLGTTLGLPPHLGALPSLIAIIVIAVWMSIGFELVRAPLPSRTTGRLRAAGAGWVALVFLIGLYAIRPLPTPAGIFRSAWLTQTMWQPAPPPGQDARLAAWESAKHRLRRRQIDPDAFAALGAVASYRGNEAEARLHYARAAWLTDPIETAGEAEQTPGDADEEGPSPPVSPKPAAR